MIRYLIPSLVAIATLAALLGGCANGKVPDDALRLHESSLELRTKQSRVYTVASQDEIVVATMAVLQDMEYNLDVIEGPLGVLTASKKVDADAGGFEKTLRISGDVMCILASGADCGLWGTAPDDQVISVTMVVLPSLARQGDFVVRVTAQYVEFNKAEMVSIRENIEDDAVYQAIFANLAKSLFLEEQQ
jgi:hypothetical protein